MPKVFLNDLIAGAIAGKVVSFPTDTVPALAVKPELRQSIFTIKKRPLNKPLILMAANFEDLLPFVVGTSEELVIWQRVTQDYWPGALTLILPASEQVSDAIIPNKLKTIGLRVPDSAIACQILQETGPLATTSANLSGETPLTSLADISATFPDILVLDEAQFSQAEITSSGLPSTIAQWEGTGWKILRQGSVIIN